MPQYVVTTNSWHEIWSLGRTVHPETDSIYYEIIEAETPGLAKQSFLRGRAIDCEYINIKCRLWENSGLKDYERFSS